MAKRVRIGKYAVPALLLLVLGVGTVVATVYVILTWTMTLPVVEYPRVNFYKWEDPGKGRTNTFDESFSIFPNVTTIQDNATYGIYSVDVGNCSLRISGIENATNIKEVYIAVFNATDYPDTPMIEITWTGGEFPTSWQSMNTTAETYYTIWMEVTGPSTLPTLPTGAKVTVQMKVESP